MNTNRSLIVLLILVALLSPGNAMAGSGTSPLPVVPVSAAWTGLNNYGLPVSFNVTSNGTQWNTFKLRITFAGTTDCGFVSGTLEVTVPGPGSVETNSNIIVAGTNFTATGQFTSTTTATGYYYFTHYPIPFGVCTFYFTHTGTWTAHAPGSDQQLISRSAGIRDGWILESAEGSNQGGTMNAVNGTFFLGDGASNRQYRSILHFNTSSLPDNAVITKVVLKIKKQGLTGIDPFTTHMKIAVDIRKGVFSNAVDLQLTDFQAGSSKPSIGFIANNPQAGNWYFTNLNATAYPFINLTGITQFRLRFQLDDNNDLGADYLKFYSGDVAAAYRPMLIITYHLP